jgi:hypothetical protein
VLRGRPRPPRRSGRGVLTDPGHTVGHLCRLVRLPRRTVLVAGGPSLCAEVVSPTPIAVDHDRRVGAAAVQRTNRDHLVTAGPRCSRTRPQTAPSTACPVAPRLTRQPRPDSAGSVAGVEVRQQRLEPNAGPDHLLQRPRSRAPDPPPPLSRHLRRSAAERRPALPGLRPMQVAVPRGMSGGRGVGLSWRAARWRRVRDTARWRPTRWRPPSIRRPVTRSDLRRRASWRCTACGREVRPTRPMTGC